MRISKSLVLLCLVLVGVAAADDEAAAPAVEADARAKLLVSKQVSSKLTLSEKPIRVYPWIAYIAEHDLPLTLVCYSYSVL